MNPDELQAQYTAILHFKDVILDWIDSMPQDAAHDAFLIAMRAAYNEQIGVYVTGGGAGWCPPV